MSKARVDVYESPLNGRWYYRVVSGNNRVVAVTSETDGFPSEQAALKAFRSAQRAFAAVKLEEKRGLFRLFR